MFFHWTMNDSKSLQVSGIILSDFNSAVVQMDSILPLISSYPYLFTKPLGTAPKFPVARDVTVTLMFHSFF